MDHHQTVQTPVDLRRAFDDASEALATSARALAQSGHPEALEWTAEEVSRALLLARILEAELRLVLEQAERLAGIRCLEAQLVTVEPEVAANDPETGESPGDQF